MRSSAVLVLTALLLGLSFWPGCSREARPDGKDFITPAAAELNLDLSLREVGGYRHFSRYCAICHGEFGAGDGFNSFNLDPKPRDLKDVFQKEGKELVEKTIREGTAALGRSPQCPPWGLTLSADAIDEVVLFIGALDTARKSRQAAAASSQGKSR
jgi:mono/diheme cytochrome c family protein